jgi:hypothetical protein
MKIFSIEGNIGSGKSTLIDILKKTDFNLIFGATREKLCETCNSYFFFYRLFTDAVKDGGWIKSGGDKEIDLNDTKITHNNTGTLLVENNYGIR